MKTLFDRNFFDEISLELNPVLCHKLREFIDAVERASDISEISAMKEITGYKGCYKVKLSPVFRLGLRIVDNNVLFITYVNRKDLVMH